MKRFARGMMEWLGWRAHFFLHHFLTHFCHFLLLPAVLLLIVGLLSGRIGTGYGTQYLVYHEDWNKRVVAGFSLTILFTGTILVSYLLECSRTRHRYEYRFISYVLETVLSLGIAMVCVLSISKLVSFAIPLLGGATGLSLPSGDDAEENKNTIRLPMDRLSMARGLVCGVMIAVTLNVVLFRLWHRAPRPMAKPSVPPPGTPSHYYFFFWLMVSLAGAYYLVAYFASKNRDGGLVWLTLLTLLVAGTFALAVLRKLLPRSWIGFSAEIHNNLIFPAAIERYRYKPAAFTFFLVGAVLLYSLAIAKWSASPVPAVCTLLLVVVGMYGLLSLILRRGLTIVLAACFLMLAAAGTIPYKYRFPGLWDYYTDADEKLDSSKQQIFNLQQYADHDNGMQDEFVQFLKKLADDADINNLRTRMKLLEELSTSKSQYLKQLGDELRKLEYAKYLQYCETLKRREGDEPAQFHWKSVLSVRDPRAGAPLEVWAEETRGQRDAAANSMRLLRMGDIRHSRYVPRDGKQPLVIITVSGGGLRSAAWTLRVLQELERRLGEQGYHLPCHTRLVAGASGGMLGAGYYTATLNDPFCMLKGQDRAKQMTEQYEMLASDFLTPIVQTEVFHDLPLFFSPSPMKRDRGIALEEAWIRELRSSRDEPVPVNPWKQAKDHPDYCRTPLAQTFADLRPGEIAGWRPSLVCSPMMIEDGRRLLVSNLDLRWVASNDGSLLNPDPKLDSIHNATMNYSQDAFEMFRLFPDAKNDLRLSTAVRMSASFPFFSPAVSLPTWPRRRIVDAGYYDNYGVSIATSWLMSRRNQVWIENNVSKIVIIQIRDGISDEQRRLAKIENDQSSPMSRALEELTSPLEGLDNGRVGSSSFRNDGQLEQVTRYYLETRGQGPATDQKDRFLTTITFEFPIPASLSWYLTANERDAIDVLAQGTSDRSLYKPGERFYDLVQRHDKLKTVFEAGRVNHEKRFEALLDWWGRPTEPSTK